MHGHIYFCRSQLSERWVTQLWRSGPATALSIENSHEHCMLGKSWELVSMCQYQPWFSNVLSSWIDIQPFSWGFSYWSDEAMLVSSMLVAPLCWPSCWWYWAATAMKILGSPGNFVAHYRPALVSKKTEFFPAWSIITWSIHVKISPFILYISPLI